MNLEVEISCQALSHTHTHSHSHPHSLTLSLSFTHTHSLTLTHTDTDTHAHSRHSHSRSHSHSLSLSLSLTLTLTHTHTTHSTITLTHTRSPSHTLTLTLTLTPLILQSLSPTLALTLTLTLTLTHTLEILCTELNAVPHAGLGFQFLRVPVRTIGAWGSGRGSEAKSSRSKTANESNRLTTCRSHLPLEVLGLASCHFSKRKMKKAGTSVSVPTDISVQCKPLRWAGTCMNNQPPCFKMKNQGSSQNQGSSRDQSERIPMIPRVTHTRLPEGRQDFKPRAKGGVRFQ